MTTLAPPGPTIPATRLPLGAEPRVQLLPPSVREREKARGSQRLALLLVVLGVAVAAALVALGFLRNAASEVSLQEANARTTQMLAEKAKYVEATQVSTTIGEVQEAQLAMTSYEIGISDLLGQLQVRLTPGMALTDLTVAVQPPWGLPLVADDILSPPRIANVSLVLTSASIQQATDFRDALSTMPGYANALVTDSAVGTDGTVTTKVELALATGAVSKRFAPAASDTTTDSDTTTADAGAEG
jgi:hypothetical protein